MPHFRIVDEDNLPESEAAYERSRVHIRSAYRRKDEGKNYHAIATMYDALEYALRWYLLENGTEVAKADRFDLERAFSHISLPPSKILRVIEIMDELLDLGEESVPDSIISEFFEISDEILTFLGITPFDFSTLPNEFPGIY